MGGQSSKKNLDIQHLEGLETIESPQDIERRKIANPSRTDKKRNTYLTYKDMFKPAGKMDPPKTGVEDDSQTVQTYANPTGADGNEFKTVRPDIKPISEDDRESQDSAAYENVDFHRDVGHAETVKPETKPTSEDDRDSHDSAAYENIKFHREDDRDSHDSAAYENIKFHRAACGKQCSSVSEGRLHAEAEMSLRRYYRELKRRISVNDVCDHLIQNNVLRQEDCEDIKSKKQLQSADRLLQIIMRKNQLAYEIFLEALRSTGVQDLADKLQAPVTTERPCIRRWNESNVLKVWPKIENCLMKELSPQYIIDFFMQENIFSVDEYEVIFRCWGKRMKMVKKLVETIHQKLPSSLFVLVYALEEIGNGKETFIVKQLETIINDESSLNNAAESDREEETVTTITVTAKEFTEVACTVKVPLSRDGPIFLKLSLKKAGQTVAEAEEEIVTCINTTDDPIKFQMTLKPTDCKIIKSEHGCVIVHLWPQSRDAYQKLFEFCKKGEMEKFVLDLLREKDIISSVPEGELRIDLKVSYREQEQEQEMEETGEPQTDLMQLIKDNRSCLREEIELQTLISEILENEMLKKMFKDEEITELKRLLAKDRLQAADYFMKCLQDRDLKTRQLCIDTLQAETKTKIFERLIKSGSIYRNSQAFQENILNHYELVVDEIDPSHFEDTFMDRGILNKTFFEDLREKQMRRRARAVYFLKEVLDKGGRALFALVDVLREMGCVELVEKLTFIDAKSQKPMQQRKVRVCNDERKDYVNVEVFNTTTPEVLMWSGCMTVIVEKKQKGDKNADSSDVSNTNKEHIYENFLNDETTPADVLKDENDEGIGEAEDACCFCQPIKTEMSQIYHPEDADSAVDMREDVIDSL